MHGRIMFINSATATGMIVGADRNRYQFVVSDWEDSQPPARNMEVSFATELCRALKVRPGNGQERTVDIFPEPLPKQAAHPDPDMGSASAISPQDVEEFRDRLDLDEPAGASGDIAYDASPLTAEPLGHGELLRELDEAPLQPAATRAASPVFQVQPQPFQGGSSIKYYAIGVAASIAVTAIAFLAVRL